MSNNDSSAPKGAAYPRRKPRYAANLQVLVFTKGLNHFLSERTANISSGGLFVCTDHPAEVGERLHIRVTLNDIDSYFDVKTEVAWVCDGSSSHPQGLGLMFVELSSDQQQVIDKILKNYVNVKER